MRNLQIHWAQRILKPSNIWLENKESLLFIHLLLSFLWLLNMSHNSHLRLVLYLQRRNLLCSSECSSLKCAYSPYKILQKGRWLGDCYSLRSLNASHVDNPTRDEGTISLRIEDKWSSTLGDHNHVLVNGTRIVAITIWLDLLDMYCVFILMLEKDIT